MSVVWSGVEWCGCGCRRDGLVGSRVLAFEGTCGETMVAITHAMVAFVMGGVMTPRRKTDTACHHGM